MFVLARMSAPASFIRVTMVASRAGTKSSKSADPYVVRMSLVSTWSLSRTGMQCSGPVSPSVASALSRRAASSRTRGLSVAIVLSRGPRWSYASMRARYACTRPTHVRSPERKAAWTSAIVASSTSNAWARSGAAGGARKSAATAASVAGSRRTIRPGCLVGGVRITRPDRVAGSRRIVQPGRVAGRRRATPGNRSRVGRGRCRPWSSVMAIPDV